MFQEELVTQRCIGEKTEPRVPRPWVPKRNGLFWGSLCLAQGKGKGQRRGWLVHPGAKQSSSAAYLKSWGMKGQPGSCSPFGS